MDSGVSKNIFNAYLVVVYKFCYAQHSCSSSTTFHHLCWITWLFRPGKYDF